MIKKLIDILYSCKSVRFAYLFGSYAKGVAEDSSDVDVAVCFKSGIDLYDARLTLHHTLEKTLRKPVDLIVLNTIKNYDLLNDILSDGVVMVDHDPEARKLYEVQMEHDIKDYDVFKRMLDVA